MRHYLSIGFRLSEDTMTHYIDERMICIEDQTRRHPRITTERTIGPCALLVRKIEDPQNNFTRLVISS